MGITVLSLFDGMSCGQIALRELGVAVDAYYASEIDRHCIAQTRLNFPGTIQLGDVRGVRAADLPRIDLILAGSPCQGFSFAGKQLNFDDPRSALFFQFLRILHEVQESNPGVKYLLENVRMKKESEETITRCLGGLRSVMINSSLVSAQNRVRLYWSNLRTKAADPSGSVTDIPQPEDRGLYLADILEEEVEERYNISDEVLRKLIAHKERNARQGRGFGMVVKYADEKSTAVKIGGKGMYDIVCVALRGRENPDSGRTEQRAEARKDGKTNTITTVQKDNLVLRRTVRQLNPSTESGGKQPYQQNRVYAADGISPALCSSRRGQSPLVITPDDKLRRLTPTECARLQTIPAWYRWQCSATQQYKMLGNGWTVEVIKHILSYMDK